jgi:hypothetical protein
VATILESLESRYGVRRVGATVPERIKRLRHRAIERLESTTDRSVGAECERDLDDLFLATQLFSYQIDYVAERPTVERLAETLDKFEEDVLGAPTASVRGIRRAIISFGEPVTVGPRRSSKVVAAEITATLQERVQRLVDEINESLVPAPPQMSPPPAHVVEATPAPWLEPAGV